MQKKPLPVVLLVCMTMIFTSAFAVFADAGQNNEEALKVEYADSSAWNNADTSNSELKVQAVRDKAFLLRVSEGAVVSVAGNTISKIGTADAAKAIEGIDTAGKGDYYKIDTKSAGDVTVSVKLGDKTFAFKLQVSEKTGPAESKIGWREVSGDKYYYYDETNFYKGTFAQIEGSRYYFNADGHLVYGAFKEGSDFYFADPSTGKIETKAGWVKDGDNDYYVRNGGRLYRSARVGIGRYNYCFRSNATLVKRQIYTVRGKYYYAGSNGVTKAYPGWVRIDDKTYHAGSGGVLDRSGRVKIGRYYYCFRSNATLVTRQIYTVRGRYYYAGSNGVTKAYPGWVRIDDKTYHAGSGGVLDRSERVKIGMYYYCFRSNATRVESQIYTYRGNYYYAGVNGVTKAYPGWVRLNDETYYAGSGGRLYHAEFFVTGGKAYYTASNGSIVKYDFTKNGVSVSPDPETGAIDMVTYEKVIYASSPYGYSDYVLIDISSQNLRYYKGGRLILKTDVVTGKNGSRTPTGKFKLVTKSRNTKLYGPGYVSFVKYWMPFIGSQVGMHDASWRNAFGGSIYIRNGSHGCVNMPTAAASSLYSRVTPGRTIVIVRN